MIKVIAAVSMNGVYGAKGILPWRFKKDMDFFKEITTGHTVVMGRSTFESMGSKPLPNRQNVVVSSGNLNTYDESFSCVSSVEEAIEIADREDIFLIGGKSIWHKGIKDLAEELYITEILSIFPEKNSSVFPALNHPGHFTDRVFSKKSIYGVLSDIDRLTGIEHRLHFAKYEVFKI